MLGNQTSDRYPTVSVVAPARLHMGFLDLGGSLGRHYGSIGVGINEIVTRIDISPADQMRVDGPSAERALKIARRFSDHCRVHDRVAIRIQEAVPEHVGLGAGTQMALAVGAGLARFHDLTLDIQTIASLVERGARSGIGIAVFERGGLIVDGGRGPATITPPILSRMEIPPDWRFILALDPRGQGLHGTQEIDAFRALPAFPVAETARLCHLLLMRALPALAEGDIIGFGSVITELQNAVGDHFAPAQGGRFTSPEVGAAMDWLAKQGAVGIGQSSWGPTGFCLVDGHDRTQDLANGARDRYPGLNFIVATARNRGAEVIRLDEAHPTAADRLPA